VDLILLSITEGFNLPEIGRPSKNEPSEFVKVSFTIPFCLLSLLDEQSKLRGYTRSEAVRQAVRKMLEIWTGRRL